MKTLIFMTTCLSVKLRKLEKKFDFKWVAYTSDHTAFDVYILMKDRCLLNLTYNAS